MPNKTILIVEDDEIILRSLYLTLHGEGFTIATAEDGQTAYEMTERMTPDLILLDLVLPKKNGFEYLREKQSNKKIDKIPVVVLSNLSGEENINRATDLGAIDYFVKSNTDLEVLVEKIRTII